MAKHPVPKKKTSKCRTKRRYSKFQRETQLKILNKVNLVPCPECGSKRLSHHVCQECGTYRGRKVIDMDKKVDKITTIKA